MVALALSIAVWLTTIVELSFEFWVGGILKAPSGLEWSISLSWGRTSGLCNRVHILEIPDNSETLENLERNPRIYQGESDHCLENLDILEILEFPSVKTPFL